MTEAKGPLSWGRETLAIPGPSIIPERVLAAMHRASPNIYEGALIDTVDTLFPDLKAVARTDGHVAIYIANGHGAWEAALAQCGQSGRDRAGSLDGPLRGGLGRHRHWRWV